MGQNNREVFRSGGGFRINLPKTFTSVEETSFDGLKLWGHGKSYVWKKPEQYDCYLYYYKLENEKNSLTDQEKRAFIEKQKKVLVEAIAGGGHKVTEATYSFQGSAGVEVQADNPSKKTKMLARFFMVNLRFFGIAMIFDSESFASSDIYSIFDSFAMLDPDSLKAAKLEEAEPKPLPQEPVAVKVRSDAQDDNLKGKVKSVIEDTQETPTGKRTRASERYFNEAGNLVREISYDEGYPSDIRVWGYIDGYRVDRRSSINFDSDQRPPRDSITATMDADETLPRDTRFTSRYSFKYDENGRLLEKLDYNNNGQLWTRFVYSYRNNIREESRYGQDGKRWTHFFNVLDKDGNVIEEYFLDEKGNREENSFFTYVFDSQGNWIVQKAFERKIVKGKPVKRFLWNSYRTIAYYP